MKNIKHIWTVLCQSSSIDADTNLLSISNIAEELKVEIDKTKIPAQTKVVIPLDFQVISFWLIENTDKDQVLETRIELVSPENKILHIFEKKYDIKMGVKRLRNRVNFGGIPISNGGRYIVRVQQKNIPSKKFDVVSELPLDVDFIYKSSK